MFIHVTCPHCGKSCKAAAVAAGRRGKCASCGGVVQIPNPPAPETAAMPPQPGGAVERSEAVRVVHVRPVPPPVATPVRRAVAKAVPPDVLPVARPANRARGSSPAILLMAVGGGVLLVVVALVLILIMAVNSRSRVIRGPVDVPAGPVANAPPLQEPGARLLPLENRQPAAPAAPAADAELSPDTLFSRSSPAVMQVVIQDNLGRTLGGGSGFLVSSSGLIVTNYHVIRGAHKAQVILADKTKLPVAGLAGSEKNVDLAILKVTGRLSAQPLPLAADDLPRIGTKVYAIGNPLGFSNTLSDGLVSGHRQIGGFELIQTSAPISPGSSGGPLLEPSGKVVGVTTLQFRGGQNLNFAVPASKIAKLLAQCEGKTELTRLPIPGEHLAGGPPFSNPNGGPDLTLRPTFGAVALKAGFVPDPFVKTLVAGGPIKTSLGGVPAWVAQPPDFQLFYTANNAFPLTIRVQCAEPTTLLVNLPDGTWVADGGKGAGPSLRFARPRTGRYDIWVGTRDAGLLPNATVTITEKE
jgi:S1-C subfamily serine protease